MRGQSEIVMANERAYLKWLEQVHGVQHDAGHVASVKPADHMPEHVRAGLRLIKGDKK